MATNGIALNQWGLGVTAIVLKQLHGWTIGGLANQVWSVSNNESDSETSATYIQPFLGYSTPKATTFTINSESTCNWVSRNGQCPST